MTTAQEREDLRKLAEAASALDHNERMNWYSYEELIDAAMQREIDDLRTALAKAERTLTLAGYTDEHGAELWKPPLGPSAAKPKSISFDEAKCGVRKPDCRDKPQAGIRGV